MMMGNAVLGRDLVRVTVALQLGKDHPIFGTFGIADLCKGGAARAQSFVLLPIASFNMVRDVMPTKCLLVHQLQIFLDRLLEVCHMVEAEYTTALCLEVWASKVTDNLVER
jgi:hypothetical protein